MPLLNVTEMSPIKLLNFMIFDITNQKNWGGKERERRALKIKRCARVEKKIFFWCGIVLHVYDYNLHLLDNKKRKYPLGCQCPFKKYFFLGSWVTSTKSSEDFLFCLSLARVLLLFYLLSRLLKIDKNGLILTVAPGEQQDTNFAAQLKVVV